ncbi:long-chain-fatty-acid--CoA ligase [Cryptosporangium aurantiacum]|uniref:Long-chain acyl-CoA synthetase n=1 Tax=Cryptosporangium aurantiacum TaxID=134849 RepID=A0A1M7QVP6_9ACTN|nr:long-chain fatty acid--CoA ligase [Cryptosporangium aurantiacum]SHN36003.1 long-chain acyl-CoA synthetase [Cryptosporangium aurantiacum]
MPLTVASILAETAARRPTHPALVLGDLRLPYAAVWDQAKRYAAVFRAQGIGPGDRVSILIPNTPHFVFAYYGAAALGAVVVPVHALLRAEEIEYVLRDSGSKLFVCAGPLLGEGAKGAELAEVPLLTVLGDMGPQTDAPRLDELAQQTEPVRTYEQAEPDDVAVILYTSGTTGKPKGAMLTHLNIVMNVDSSVISSFDTSPDDVVLGCLPLFHSFGQTVSMNVTFRAGGTLVLMPRFDGPGALALMLKEKVTNFIAVPTMYMGLLDAMKQSESDEKPPLRLAISGGASLPLTVLEEFEQVFGIPVYEGYGLTETSPVATFNQKGWPTKPGTVGRPIWGVDAEIARPEIEERIELLPTGELGEIVIRGHNIMKGYLNRPEATAEAIVDGWFRTGDLGTKDGDGYITIVDRKKDMVLRGGFNVYPREVEEVLMRHPDVAQVAVIAVPHPTHGEEVCAVIVPTAGSTPDAEQIIGWAKTHLAGHKYPRIVEFVDAFPLGPSGKVLKRELKTQFG